MKKRKDWVRKSLSLDIDTNELIEFGKLTEGFKTDSEFVDFLVHNWSHHANPMKELDSIKAKISEKEKDLTALKQKETECFNRFKKIDKWKNFLNDEKEKVISNIVRMISEKRKLDADRVATTQSIRLGIKKEDLLDEALTKLKSGI